MDKIELTTQDDTLNTALSSSNQEQLDTVVAQEHKQSQEQQDYEQTKQQYEELQKLIAELTLKAKNLTNQDQDANEFANLIVNAIENVNLKLQIGNVDGAHEQYKNLERSEAMPELGDDDDKYSFWDAQEAIGELQIDEQDDNDDNSTIIPDDIDDESLLGDDDHEDEHENEEDYDADEDAAERLSTDNAVAAGASVARKRAKPNIRAAKPSVAKKHLAKTAASTKGQNTTLDDTSSLTQSATVTALPILLTSNFLAQTTKVSMTAATAQYKYAPQRKPIAGDINVGCVAIKWPGNQFSADIGNVSSMGRNVAAVYKALSSNQLKLSVVSKRVKVSFNKSKGNVSAAEKQAQRAMNKNRAKGQQFTKWLIVNGNAKNFSNAGNDIAHLRDALDRTAYHEFGHLLGFGHAGAYNRPGGKLDQYGDGTSFMSKYATNKINAPQLYFAGWSGDNKTALFDMTDPDTEFNMEYSYVKTPDANNFTGVYIPRPDRDRDLFFSIAPVGGNMLACVHYIQNHGAGTQRIRAFNKTTEVEGLKFERLETNNSAARFKISRAT